MTIVNESFFRYLKPPVEGTTEPMAQKVGTYYISRLIAKKTKFRVSDVSEVMKEAGSAIFMTLLERKSVDLDGIVIRNRWHRLEEPKFIRTEREGKEGVWVYGYYAPQIEMGKFYKGLYLGKDLVPNEEITAKIAPYFPEGLETVEDVRAYARKLFYETCQLGKDQVVDDESYIIPVPGSRKRTRKYFDPTFHPNWAERLKYNIARKRAIKDYYEKKRNGEDVGEMPKFVQDRLVSEGFKVGPDKEVKPSELQKESE